MNLKEFLFSMTVICALSFECGAIELVKDSKPLAKILAGKTASPTDRFAAEELASFVLKMTGAELKITESAANDETLITFSIVSDADAQGNGAMANAIRALKDDGFLIVSEKKALRIISKRNRGLLYGTYHILKKYGGVAWLYPGEEGEVCPKSSDFAVPEQLTVINPAFRFRGMRVHSKPGWIPETYLWIIRNGLQFSSVRNPYMKKGKPTDMTLFIEKLDPVYTGGGHDFSSQLIGYYSDSNERKKAAEELFREHPEYFGMRNGKRIPPFSEEFCQPCTSNPAAVRRMAENTARQIDDFGTMENIRIFINDDHPNWCECENCRKLDPPEETEKKLVSTRWWLFINSMADALLTSEHPNLIIDAFLYQTFRFPPKGCIPDPRVMVSICPHGRCYLHSLDDASCRVNAGSFREMFESWSRLKFHARTFEYHIDSPLPVCYQLDEETWIKDLKFYHKLGMAGFGMVTNTPEGSYKGKANEFRHANYWLANWQMHYLTGIFSWDIDADFKDMSEQANLLYYGKAWEYIKPYRAILQGALAKSGGHMGYGMAETLNVGKCYDDPELRAGVEKYLGLAEAASKDDPIIGRRIAREREFLNREWVSAYKSHLLLSNPLDVPESLQKIKVDGVLDEKVWSISIPITEFAVSGKDGGKPALQTSVRLAHDGGNIYFGITAMKAKSGDVADFSDGNGFKALDGSRFDLYLVPPWYIGKGQKFYRFTFTHNGKTEEELAISAVKSDDDFKLYPEIEVRDESDRWTAEVRIRVGKLGGGVTCYQNWRVNVVRTGLLDSGSMETGSISMGNARDVLSYRAVCFVPDPKNRSVPKEKRRPTNLKFE